MEPLRTTPHAGSIYELLRSIVEREAGIRLSNSKEAFVFAKLAKRVEVNHCKSVRQYILQLQEPRFLNAELQELINCLTINKTDWFREAVQFPFIANQLKSATERRQPFKIWCAACSQGHEPYSVAIYLLEKFPNSEFSIFASDVDSQVLAVAKNGVYPSHQLSGIRGEYHRWFDKGQGEVAGWVRIGDAVRRHVKFTSVNLNSPRTFPKQSFDIILCRNVFIYFSDATITSIVNAFAGCSHREGALLVGQSESLQRLNSGWKIQGDSIYTLTDSGSDKSELPLNGRFGSMQLSQPKGKAQGKKIDGIVAIGSSTGGLEALSELFSMLEGKQMPPILVAQHIQKGFIRSVVNGFNSKFSRVFTIAEHGTSLVGNRVYFAPDGYHLGIERRGEEIVIGLGTVQSKERHVPSVDRLFESLVKSKLKLPAAVCVLTGMGKDGASHIRSLKENGIEVFSQDKMTSLVDGMPAAVRETGLVKKSASPKKLAMVLSDYFSSKVRGHEER